MTPDPRDVARAQEIAAGGHQVGETGYRQHDGVTLYLAILDALTAVRQEATQEARTR